MARKSNLASMSVAALLKMRDDIGEVLSRRASELKKELSQLTDWGSKAPKGPKIRKGRKGKKVAPQFRSKKDPKVVWSGRGGTPRWMKEEMKGTKLKKENFRIK
jgi:DNA-binding protein H-NS